MYLSLNEHEDAERYLKEYDIGKDAFYKLTVIARYYIDIGLSKKCVREKLFEYVSRTGNSPSLNYWSDMIDAALKKASKRKAITIDSIFVNQAEMDKIGSLDGIQAKRLAFTLLCLSKYRDEIIEDNDHWVCYEDKEIMKMANIKVSLMRQAELYRQLRDAGYLKFPKKKNSISMQVLFAEPNCHEDVLEVINFKNLGYQYLKYIGEPYFECACCGNTVKLNNKKTGRPQKYCDQCAALIRAKQNTDSVMRLRMAEKTMA